MPAIDRRWFACGLICIALCGSLRAADPIPAASERFANSHADETPSLRQHVLPLLGRLGCNGRACHGSFQGQGGFRLSLFGYDFESDHAALAGGDAPRVDVKNPLESLILQKPTLLQDHEGGKRFAVDTWQYHLLRNWIRAGAPAVQEADAELVALEVEPREMVFDRVGQTSQLRAVARWSDGREEVVTPLCRFRSNDESIASIDNAGLVTALDKGDTDVVAFYDNGVSPVQVLLPVSPAAGPRYPQVPAPTKIDELVVAKLRKLGIVPSELCSDAEFLRRVNLDLTGSLPGPEEVLAFLESTSPDKRRQKIDELLERPAYAAWWTTRLCDLTGNNANTGPQGGEQSLNRDKAKQWYDWIYRRVQENLPYDQLIEGIVLSVSRPAEQSYEDYCAEMSSYFRKDEPADFTARSTMPYFWSRRQLGQSSARALAFAYSFLGVSLQCAECHKHPYDQWTKQDFDQFSLFFDGVRYGAGNRTASQAMKQAVGLTGDEDSGAFKRQFVELLQQGKTLPFKEVSVPNPSGRSSKNVRNNPKSGRVITPKLLGGEEVLAREYNDPRQPLMDWMRETDNPYFARAWVNRVWAGYFHVGIIEPPDDMNLANPPSNPALLDYLAQGFTEHHYDMKWLHRQIANSRTYQLSCRANETNQHDERNFSRGVIRRLPAEVAYDALVSATASDAAREQLNAEPAALRAIGSSTGYSTSRDNGNYAVNLFGKPARLINCDCERSNEPNLLQMVYLRNDQEVLTLLDRKDGWLRQVSLSGNADDLIRGAYLRTVSRLPNEKEVGYAREHLAKAADLRAGLRDLMWALLNTKEFIVNR